MKWSKYNFLFQSEKFGGFLYNSLSNVFIELDDDVYACLERFKDNLDESELEGRPELRTMLEEKKILVNAWDEENALNIRRYIRDRQRHDSSSLGLTLAPTFACNFRCPYCVQHKEKSSWMSEETIENLIHYIQNNEAAKKISINWFGGEPLLAFPQIEKITARIKELDKPYTASMISNGYLLDSKKVDRLKELNINFIQLTIDGPREVHNSRRTPADGTPTFDRILDNADYLTEQWDGHVSFRVNLDSSNAQNYPELRQYLLERFKDRKVDVYSHYVFNSPQSNPNANCQFGIPEWTDFTLEMFKKEKILPKDPLYPNTREFNNCVANSRNGYVIGPEGEIYKCWEDVCNPERVVGNINLAKEGNIITNPELLVRYAYGVDPYEDPECRQCPFLPICSGSCPFFRMENKYHGGSFDICTRFKTRLKESLELYYDLIMDRVIADYLLKQKGSIVGEHGFMVISDIRFEKEENENEENIPSDVKKEEACS